VKPDPDAEAGNPRELALALVASDAEIPRWMGFNGVEARDNPSLSDHGWFDDDPTLEIVGSFDAVAYTHGRVETKLDSGKNGGDGVGGAVPTGRVKPAHELKTIIESVAVGVCD
jgi:hypothetical protein